MAKTTPQRHANAPKKKLKIKIRRDDVVKVIAGRDKGKTGRVLHVDREKGKLLVEGISMVKRHTRPNPAKQMKGGIAERESPIDVSNVLLVNSRGEATRVGYRIEGSGPTAHRVRIAKKGGEVMEKRG
jgi:large subunit ribosomal protein L24